MMEKKKTQSYSGDEVTVTFDPNVCIHAALCVGGPPEVFDVAKKRWIQPDNASVEKVVEAVKKCPSGALQYSLAKPSSDSA